MRRPITRAVTRLMLAFLAVLFVVPGGCRKETPKDRIQPLEGKVEKIDAKRDGTGTLTVRFYSDKHEQYQNGVGVVTSDTKITIDGVAAKLADINTGEYVRGHVLVESVDGKQRNKVIDITVERPKAVVPEPAADDT